MAGAPVVAATTSFNAPVHINVGGTSYTSTLETLTKYPYSKLAKYFNGSLPVTVDPLKNQYFLDRDGKTFRHVLNFLRNTKLILPDNFGELKLLQEEALYFEIEDLSSEIQQSIEKRNGTVLERVSQTDNSSSEETEDLLKNKKIKKKKRSKTKRRLENVEKTSDDLKEKQDHKETDDCEGQEPGNNKSGQKMLVTDEDMEEGKVTTIEASFTNLKEKRDHKKTDDCEGQLPGNDKSGQKVLVTDEKVEERKVTTIEASLTSKNHDLVCVVTDLEGEVKELWCADDKLISSELKEYVIDTFNEATLLCESCYKSYSHYIFFKIDFRAEINYYGKNHPSKMCKYCKKSIGNSSKNYWSISCGKTGFPVFSQFLFNKNYKLVSSLSTGAPNLVLHHYFVKLESKMGSQEN